MLLPYFLPSYIYAFEEEKAYCPLLRYYMYFDHT